jgi:3-dehydroquinate dehydratase-2
MASILLLHGPNLNLLGKREPDKYGSVDLATIDQNMSTKASQMGHTLTSFQSNDEAVLIERIHAARDDGTEFLLFNPAAFTHTSVALRDAVLAVELPMVEIHLSNVYTREAFRHHSYFSDIAVGVVSGFGAYSYDLALLAAHNYFQQH